MPLKITLRAETIKVIYKFSTTTTEKNYCNSTISSLKDAGPTVNTAISLLI